MGLPPVFRITAALLLAAPVAACATYGAAPTAQPAPSATTQQAFHDGVSEAWMRLLPLCTRTSAAPNHLVVAPSRAKLEAFRATLDGTPYAAIFDAAVSETETRRSQMVARCAMPQDIPLAQAQAEPLRATENAIAQLRRMMTQR